MTYLTSYFDHNGESGCVELPSMLKLLVWIVKNAWKHNEVLIQIMED